MDLDGKDKDVPWSGAFISFIERGSLYNHEFRKAV